MIGLTWDDAQQVLQRQGLVGTLEDPAGSLLAAMGWPNAVVSDQVPESDARVPVGSSVKLWLGRGGGSAGVREPRRPKPSPWGVHEMRAEPLNE